MKNMTKQDVINLMKSSKTGYEWNDNCVIVKKSHNNNYPTYWYKEIILSGIYSEVFYNIKEIVLSDIYSVVFDNIKSD